MESLRRNSETSSKFGQDAHNFGRTFGLSTCGPASASPPRSTLSRHPLEPPLPRTHEPPSLASCGRYRPTLPPSVPKLMNFGRSSVEAAPHVVETGAKCCRSRLSLALFRPTFGDVDNRVEGHASGGRALCERRRVDVRSAPERHRVGRHHQRCDRSRDLSQWRALWRLRDRWPGVRSGRRSKFRPDG